MPRDLPCVYRAASIGEADIVAAWLEERGIPAFVKDQTAAVVFQTSLIVAPKGIEVCVGPDHADEASRLLTRHVEDLRRQKDEAGDAPLITGSCEDCGKDSTFPAGLGGTVQTCPHCKGYMDVPAGG